MAKGYFHQPPPVLRMAEQKNSWKMVENQRSPEKNGLHLSGHGGGSFLLELNELCTFRAGASLHWSLVMGDVTSKSWERICTWTHDISGALKTAWQKNNHADLVMFNDETGGR